LEKSGVSLSKEKSDVFTGRLIKLKKINVGYIHCSQEDAFKRPGEFSFMLTLK